MARPYRYFAFHRPDMWLYGIPPYAGWAFADAGLARTALFCDGGASHASPNPNPDPALSLTLTLTLTLTLSLTLTLPYPYPNPNP